MLKHIICALTLSLSAPLAAASPDTAENWGLQASEIYAEANAMMADIDQRTFSEVSTGFEDRLVRFAATATHLGGWTDDTQNAPDLGCIYRGMAEEAELQLIKIENAASYAELKAALTRIATMADDAQSIAVASAHAGRTGQQAAPTGQCLTNTMLVDHVLGTSAD